MTPSIPDHLQREWFVAEQCLLTVERQHHEGQVFTPERVILMHCLTTALQFDPVRAAGLLRTAGPDAPPTAAGVLISSTLNGGKTSRRTTLFLLAQSLFKPSE